MKLNTFPDLEVGDFYNKHFICVSYDMTKEQGKIFKNKFPGSVLHLPSMLYLDPKGTEIVHKIIGGKNPDDFLAEGKRAVSDTSLKTLKERYDKGEREYKFFIDFVQATFKSGDRDHAKWMVETYYAENDSTASLYDSNRRDFYFKFATNIESKLFQDILKNRRNISNAEDVIYACLNNATGELFFPKADGAVITLPRNEELYKAYSKCLSTLRMHGKSDKYFVFKYIYDRSTNGDYTDAFYAVKYAKAFGFKMFTNRYVLNMYTYLTTHCKDNALKEQINEEIKKIKK